MKHKNRRPLTLCRNRNNWGIDRTTGIILHHKICNRANGRSLEELREREPAIEGLLQQRNQSNTEDAMAAEFEEIGSGIIYFPAE